MHTKQEKHKRRHNGLSGGSHDNRHQGSSVPEEPTLDNWSHVHRKFYHTVPGFNRICWCAVAWIQLIPLIPLPHLKLRRKDHCSLLSVIPSLNLQPVTTKTSCVYSHGLSMASHCITFGFQTHSSNLHILVSVVLFSSIHLFIYMCFLFLCSDQVL